MNSMENDTEGVVPRTISSASPKDTQDLKDTEEIQKDSAEKIEEEKEENVEKVEQQEVHPEITTDSPPQVVLVEVSKLY